MRGTFRIEWASISRHLAHGFYLFQMVYVFFALKRWSDSINSYGGVTMVGSVLAGLPIAAGLSICSFTGVQFSALSTQVISIRYR